MKKTFSILLLTFLCLYSCFADIKEADKAGSWYPGSRSQLERMINSYLEKAAPGKVEGDIIGIISPHAGYVFSAPVAAYGYKKLRDKGIRTAIVVGFNHAISHDGIAVCDYDEYSTPLGKVRVDREITEALIKQNEKIYSYKKAFDDEQSTELQVPFLQTVLTDFSIVIVSIGNQSLENSKILADALFEVLKDRQDYVLVASTDMCHYLAYDKNNEIDQYTIALLEKNDPEGLFYASAAKGHRLMCGPAAVTAAMMACKKLGADTVTVLKHANSGDVSFDRRRVVGYLSALMIRSESGAGIKKNGDKKKEIKISKKGEDGMLNEEQKVEMLKLARDAIITYLKRKKRLAVEYDDSVLNSEMGAFVTLHKHGKLRGCIGNMIGRGPFYLTVREMAIQAATGDPRFSSVTIDEMKDIDIEISVLSPLEKISDPEIIKAGVHGVLVRQGERSGVYLPQVAIESGWDKEQFMNSLCGHKARIAPDAWKKGECEIYIFTAEVFGETE